MLDDPGVRDQVLAQARYWVDINRGNQSFLGQQLERLSIVLAKDTHESVRRAAYHVKRILEHHGGHQDWLARRLGEGIAAVEKVSCLRDAAQEGAALLDVMKHQGADDLTASDVVTSDLAAAVDAIEFAASTDRSRELRKASGAMERILGGVTELRELGFSVGEIQSTVDDFISQKTKPGLRGDFSLLAPVISETDTKGTTRNKRMAAKRRDQLLETDEWVRRFLNEFWCKYWRNAFERSVPEERETNIECACGVIPGILDAAKEPMGVDDLLPEVWGRIKERRRSGEAKVCRIRLRDEHTLITLDRLVQSGSPASSAVVRIDGVPATYWTRHRAVAAGLKIVPPRLTLVPPDEGGTRQQ